MTGGTAAAFDLRARAAEARAKRSSKLIIPAVAALAVLVRFLPLLHSRVTFAYYLKDSPQYIELANGLRHGCGFARLNATAPEPTGTFLKPSLIPSSADLTVRNCGPPELLRTPGYPLFLALMPSLRIALAVQGLLAGIVCLLVGVWITPRWGITAAVFAELLIAVDIPAIVVTDQFMSEQQFQLLLLLSVLPPLIIGTKDTKYRKVIIAAVFSGCAAALALLTRPIGIVLPLIVPIPFLLMRSAGLKRRAVAAAIAFVIPALALAGWSLRNYREANYFGLSSVSAINLYYYRAPEVLAWRYGSTIEAERIELGRALGVPFENIYEAQNQSRKLQHRMASAATRVFLAYPAETMLTTFQGALYNAFAPMRSELGAWLMLEGRGRGLNRQKITPGAIEKVLRKVLRSPLMTALIAFQMVVLLALWSGVAVALVRSFNGTAAYRKWVIYLTLVALLFLGLAAGGEACQRFRVPVIPLLAIVAGLGFFGSAIESNSTKSISRQVLHGNLTAAVRTGNIHE
jgi:hypothetical protein